MQTAPFKKFKSKYTIPKEDEGFSEVKKINWVPDFQNEQERKLFLEQY